MKNAVLFSVLILLVFIKTPAQINAYAKVTGISNGSVLALSNVNQTFHSFTAGEQVIIIQMQGASISDNSNASSFGTLNSLNSAGLYEVATILAVNGGPTSMTLSGSLANSYSSAGSIQVVSYRRLGTSSFTTTAAISGLAWNGDVGGVIACYVSGNLYQLHNISANAIGFRGGSNVGQSGGGCESATWRTSSGDSRYALKGEGVYITAAGEVAGRAKAVNGGGGGIVHNGGGGGGGNFTAGGDGYFGFTGGGFCSAATNAGGQGGLALSGSASRVFMGGGGGGGQENNNAGSAGANGGGIILLRADTLVVAGACSAVSISANGGTASSGGNDGMGGGGAGGSIVLQVGGIRAIGACPLTISSNGGNGGSVGNGASHGSGGGGGQGAVYISASGSFSNTTINTNNGAGGASRTGGGAPAAGSGGGTSGSGVITGTNSSPLPVSLSAFYAKQISSTWVQLHWSTLSEHQNKGFELLHLRNGENWELLGFVQAQQNSRQTRNYSFDHYSAHKGMNYYKLRQIDLDGRVTYSDVLYLDLQEEQHFRAYPVPCKQNLYIESEEAIEWDALRLMNACGASMPLRLTRESTTRYSLDVSAFPAGLYLLECKSRVQKIIIE